MATISDLMDAGRRLWLEGLAREQIVNRFLMEDGRRRPIAGFSIEIEACNTVLRTSAVYDRMICDQLKEGSYGEHLAMELLIDEARHAADLLRTVFQRTGGRDGWVVLPVSPSLMTDAMEMAEAAAMLQSDIHRANIMVSIPGLPHRLPVIEKLMESGIPVHIGLIFSKFQVRAITRTCLEAIEARIAAGHEPLSPCFVTIPVDRLLAGLCNLLPEEGAAEFGISVIAEIRDTARNLIDSRRWERAISAGAQAPRLIWSFAKNAGRCRSSFLFVTKLEGICAVSALTDDTVPSLFPHDPGERERTITGSRQRQTSFHPVHDDFDFAAFAERLQKDEADSLLRSWIGLLDTIARKSAALTMGRSAQPEEEGP